MYEDKTPHFVEGEDPFVMRFKVEALTELDPELGIPIKHLWPKLAMCRGVNPDLRGWPYKVRVIRSLGHIADEDVALPQAALAEQASKRVPFPLTDAEVKRLKGKRIVSLPNSTTVVEIPGDDETEDLAPKKTSDVRRSIRIQSLLAKAGIELGFRVWIPAGDRANVLKALSGEGEEHFLTRLPLNADDNTVETVERIDVLWIKGRTIVRAFEVEDTTAVYSGILRMSDLIALQPQFSIKLHIVAPEERADMVRRQILRPTFAYMEGGPLSKICTYLSYGSVEELSSQPNLRFMRDEIVEQYEEVME